MKCDNCGKNSKEANLLKAKDEEGKQVYICEGCFNILCEGYELVEETPEKSGCSSGTCCCQR